MKTPLPGILFASFLLASCATQVEGVFEPACIAYEGDRIELRDGRFEWQRFTDQVNVDENGNRIDPFPGYPMTGTYELQDERVSFVPDGSGATRDRYLLERREELYLLTYDENEAALDTGEMPGCALKRVPAE